jgi:hypothetical protein
VKFHNANTREPCSGISFKGLYLTLEGEEPRVKMAESQDSTRVASVALFDELKPEQINQ